MVAPPAMSVDTASRSTGVRPIAETSVSRPVGTNRKNVPTKNSTCERTGMVRMNCEPLAQLAHFTAPSLTACVPGPLRSRPLLFRQALDDPQRVVAIDLFQHRVGQVDAVQLPERVVVAGGVGVIVPLLQDRAVVEVIGPAGR